MGLGHGSFPAAGLVPTLLLHYMVENAGNKKTNLLKNGLMDLMRQDNRRAKYTPL